MELYDFYLLAFFLIPMKGSPLNSPKKRTLSSKIEITENALFFGKS